MPRLITDLFEINIEDTKITIEMSFIEFFKGNLIDLLKTTDENYNRIKINNKFEALKLLFEG